MKRDTIGWIGAGIMGAPMAGRLLGAGYELIVNSRTRAKAEPLLARGAKWADSPAELADRAEVVISIVSDTPDVLAVYLGEGAKAGACESVKERANARAAGPAVGGGAEGSASHAGAAGVLETVRPGTLCIDMSTIQPQAAIRVGGALAARGCGFLDAPVSGGKTGAENGTLSIMVGGRAEDLERARPIFAHLAKRVVHCGPQGHGQEVKLCNQILCALNLLAISEAVSYAQRAGLNLGRMIEAVSAGAAGSWAVENLGGRMLKGDFAPMFMVDLQQKDLRIALDAAYRQRVPLPGTALAHQLLTAAQSHGEGREGTQVLLKTLLRLAGQIEE